MEEAWAGQGWPRAVGRVAAPGWEGQAGPSWTLLPLPRRVLGSHPNSFQHDTVVLWSLRAGVDLLCLAFRSVTYQEALGL